MKLDETKPLIFLGDHHGNWNELFYLIKIKKLNECNIISVGDLGIGFLRKGDSQHKICENLSREFKNKNINFYGIRGNHDYPFYFQGLDRVSLSNFELIEDYTIAEYNGKKIQFIGGAVSIDRTARKEGVSYWEDEAVNFEKDKCQEVDILVTHTAPSWCFPSKFNQMVYGWALEDAYLLKDLTDERAVMDEIFKLCKPNFHVYGHFHDSLMEIINGCKHNLLNINELYEYKQ